MYLPPQWSVHIHPEGAMYFHRRSSTMQIITSAYLYSTEIITKVCYWVAFIEAMIVAKSMTVTESVELVLQLDGDDCFYYLANHDTQSLFWIDNYDTEDLGLLPVASPSHLSPLD